MDKELNLSSENKNLSVGKNVNNHRHFYPIIFVVIIILVSFSSKIYASFPTNRAKQLWEKSQNIQKENSFIIDGEYVVTYVRTNDKKDVYKNKIKFYKNGNKWRSEKDEEFPDEHDVFVSIYDGEHLHDFVNVEDEKNKGVFHPTELSVNKGMIIYEQSRNDGYTQETLDDIVADFNAGDKLINWYPKKWYNSDEKENPKIKGKMSINGFPCTNIKFRQRRQVCVSEDYGVAVYWRESRDESKFPGTANKEFTEEYYVKDIKNTLRDNVNIDESLFNIPSIKPMHKYGEY